VFHRETVTGQKLSAKYITPLKAGAFIYNRLFAWKASFAVVSTELADCYVSNEFPQFLTDSSKLIAEYLYLWSLTENTLRAVNAASTGSAAVSRNRFREEFFLNFELPLPPIEKQQAIVSAWEQAKTQIADMKARIAGMESQIEAEFLAALGLSKPKRAVLPRVLGIKWKELERWSVMYNQLATVSVDIAAGKFPVALLSDIASVSYGIQKCPANRPGQHARPYLRVANVQRGELDLSEVKTINVPDAEISNYRLESGDLLFVEGNGSRNELGRCAIWHGEIENCVHQNHILKVRPDVSRLLPDFAMTWFNTSVGKDHFFRNVKTSSGLGSINSTELRAAPIALPSITIQHNLMERVAAQRNAVAGLKAEADEKLKRARADVEDMILGIKPVPVSLQ
jgi:type I restriction enzyme, S subunit